MAHEYIRSKPYDKWKIKFNIPEEQGEESSASQRSKERRRRRSGEKDDGDNRQKDSRENADLAEANRQTFFKPKPKALAQGSRPHEGPVKPALGGARVPRGAIGPAAPRVRPQEGPKLAEVAGVERGAKAIGAAPEYGFQHRSYEGNPDLAKLVEEVQARKRAGNGLAAYTPETYTGEIVDEPSEVIRKRRRQQPVDDPSIWEAELVDEHPRGTTQEIRAIGTTPDKAATGPIRRIPSETSELPRLTRANTEAGEQRVARPHGGREATELASSLLRSELPTPIRNHPLLSQRQSPLAIEGPKVGQLPLWELPKHQTQEPPRGPIELPAAPVAPGRQVESWSNRTSLPKTPGSQGTLFQPRKYR